MADDEENTASEERLEELIDCARLELSSRQILRLVDALMLFRGRSPFDGYRGAVSNAVASALRLHLDEPSPEATVEGNKLYLLAFCRLYLTGSMETVPLKSRAEALRDSLCDIDSSFEAVEIDRVVQLLSEKPKADYLLLSELAGDAFAHLGDEAMKGWRKETLRRLAPSKKNAGGGSEPPD